MAGTIQLEAVIDAQSFTLMRGVVITCCLLVMFFDGYDLNLVGYVGPALISHLHLNKTEFGTVISAGLAGFMAGALLFGDLGDRFGRKRMVVLGTGFFGLLTFCCLWADTLTVFLLLRLLAGVGLGGAVPNAISLNMELSPKRSRASVIGIMFVGYTLGGAAPGWVAAATLRDFGWYGAFVFGAIPPLVIAAIMTLVLPESVSFLAARHRHIELRSLLNRLSPNSVPSADMEIVSREVSLPGLPLLQLFSNGRALNTLLIWLAFVCCLTSIVFVIAWSATLLVGLGIEPAQAALIAAMWQTGGALGSLAVTRLIDRYGIGTVAIWIALAAPSAIAIAQVGSSIPLLFGTIMVGGFFGSGGQVGMNAITGLLYPAAMRATGIGWAFGIGRVGAILGPIAGGFLISAGFSVSSLFSLVSLPFLIAAACAAMLYFREGRNPREGHELLS